jgi:hypothetical protein
MIGLSIAIGAKVLIALIASNPMVGHVLTSLGRDRVTIVILLSLLYLSWSHFDDVTTRATDHSIVFLHDLHKNSLIDFILFLLLKVLFQLEVLDIFSAFWTVNIFVFRF